ncbi:MAG: TOBE domain-containing protein, partial [Acidobacteriota bacterium]|nr:TOBE domain-containing protein [Acidobacteriota bacterium]
VKASGPVMDLLTRLDLPLSHGSGAEALIEALVSGHDEEFHMTILEFDGGRFTVPRKDLETGTTIRLRIFARDVSLTLERQSGTSIQNIFAAEVDDLFSEGDSQVTIRLKIGDGFFLALITRKSAAELDLRKGSKVFAQVKSVVLLD